MTPWDRLGGRVRDFLTEQDNGRPRVLAAVALIAIVLATATTGWLIWPAVSAAIWLVVVGAVVFMAVRLAMRER